MSFDDESVAAWPDANPRDGDSSRWRSVGCSTIGLAVIALVAVGCGGGGGSDDEDDAPSGQTSCTDRQGNCDPSGGGGNVASGDPSGGGGNIASVGNTNGSSSGSSGNVPSWLIGDWSAGDADIWIRQRRNQRWGTWEQVGTGQSQLSLSSYTFNADGTYQYVNVIESGQFNICGRKGIRGTFDVEKASCSEDEFLGCLEVTLKGKRYTQLEGCSGNSHPPAPKSPITRRVKLRLTPRMAIQVKHENREGLWMYPTEYEKTSMSCKLTLACAEGCQVVCDCGDRASKQAKRQLKSLRQCGRRAECQEKQSSKKRAACLKQNCKSEIEACLGG